MWFHCGSRLSIVVTDVGPVLCTNPGTTSHLSIVLGSHVPRPFADTKSDPCWSWLGLGPRLSTRLPRVASISTSPETGSDWNGGGISI